MDSESLPRKRRLRQFSGYFISFLYDKSAANAMRQEEVRGRVGLKANQTVMEDSRTGIDAQYPELKVVRSALIHGTLCGTPGKPQARKFLILIGCPPGIRTPIC